MSMAFLGLPVLKSEGKVVSYDDIRISIENCLSAAAKQKRNKRLFCEISNTLRAADEEIALLRQRLAAGVR